MLLFIGLDPQGELVSSEMHIKHLEAVYRLIRQPIADKLGEHSEWIVDNDTTLDAFDTLALDELPADEFNLAYRLIMANPNHDKWIGPLITELKPLFEQDPRFQAA